MNENDLALRKHLVDALTGNQAHLDFASALEDFPLDKTALKPANAPHSAWQLLEHLRIAQRDILDFCIGDNYQHRKWPDEYWPATPAPPGPDAWAQAIAAFQTDLDEMKRLVSDPQHDLYKALPHGEGQTLLREVLLVIDHNSHHLGQLLFLKKMLAS